MKVLLFLNGPEGWQTGIEDGFNYLLSTRIINELKWFYYDDFAKKYDPIMSLTEMQTIAKQFLPDLIVFFHPRKFPITINFIKFFKELPSKPIIAYDEGDMYGGLSKPFTKAMRNLLKESNVISLRGLGYIFNKVSKYNRNIFYTPHHIDIYRFNKEPYILEDRKYPIVSIGNKIQSKVLRSILSMPGAIGREKFFKRIGEIYSSSFYLFGNGWEGFIGNQGPVDFQAQMDIYKNSWVTIAYEHYPNVSYYFSNRLPIALMCGSLYVCHYHAGYEKIFKNCDFIYFFKTSKEAIDILNYILSLSKENLLGKSKRAREFAERYFTPQIIWSNFYDNVLKYASNKR